MAVSYVVALSVYFIHSLLCTTEDNYCNNLAVQDTWEECSLSCGGGIQRKKGMRNETRMCNLMNCPGDAGCISVHYTFDTLLQTQVYDISNSANHGTINGAATLNENGKFSKCIHLPKNSNISLGARGFHNRPSVAVTIALWVKLTSISGQHELFHTCASDSANGKGQYHFEINDGKVRWFHRDHKERTVFNVIAETSIPVATWTQIAVTYLTSTRMAKIYINGENTKLSTNSQLSKFGGNAAIDGLSPDWGCANIGDYKNERSLDGYVDDFFIFKCELTATEIKVLYETGSFKRHVIPVP